MRTFSYPRARSRSSVTVPTAPVAPTTPIDGCSAIDALLRERLEARVHDLHRTLDMCRADHARDADRRRRNDLDVDPGLRKRVEHVGRDTRMTLHAGADQ